MGRFLKLLVFIGLTSAATYGEGFPFVCEKLEIEATIVDEELSYAHRIVIANPEGYEYFELEYSKFITSEWSDFRDIEFLVDGTPKAFEESERTVKFPIDFDGRERITVEFAFGNAKATIESNRRNDDKMRDVPYYHVYFPVTEYGKFRGPIREIKVRINLPSENLNDVEVISPEELTLAGSALVWNGKNVDLEDEIEFYYQTKDQELADEIAWEYWEQVQEGSPSKAAAEAITFVERAEGIPKADVGSILFHYFIKLGDWGNAVYYYKILDGSGLYQKYSYREKAIAAAFLGGYRDYAVELLNDTINYRTEKLEDTSESVLSFFGGFTGDTPANREWLQTVKRAVDNGYETDSEPFLALIKPMVLDVRTVRLKKTPRWYPEVIRLGDFRDDIIYPYLLEKSLRELVQYEKDRGFWDGFPEGFDENVDYLLETAPGILDKPHVLEDAATVYLYSNRAEDAASILFNYSTAGKNPYFATLIYDLEKLPLVNVLLTREISRSKYENFDNAEEKNYYERGGSAGYMAAIITLVIVGDSEKAREYAEATAGLYPDTRPGRLAAELTRYVDRLNSK
jgi:hypothetical protein